MRTITVLETAEELAEWALKHKTDDCCIVFQGLLASPQVTLSGFNDAENVRVTGLTSFQLLTEFGSRLGIGVMANQQQ